MLNMIGEHFWKIVFVIALLVGGYFYYDHWHKQNESENRMIAMLDLIEENKALPEDATVEQAGAPLLKLMVNLNNYETYENVTNVKDLLDTIFKRAVTEERVAESEQEAFKTAILENRNLCRAYGVFDDSEGILMMENGRSPKVTKGAFKGDKLIVGHFVSPMLAPEAKNSFANLVVTPESIFGMQTEEPDRSVISSAGRLREIRAIGPGTYERMKAKERDLRAYKVGE
ncbi:MAG: hypothetical protein KDN22_11560 [Verrucomicrobiae bacterium]|nr:hypothetical protein [Verrucomicrobiae bacterium]